MVMALRGRRLNGRPYLISAAVGGGGGGAGNSTATLAAGSAIDTRRVFNRDVYAGDPAGLGTTYGKGWAAVPFTLTPSQAVSTGVWMRLHDASSSGATTTAGSGTVLQAPVQVAASLTTGANAITVNVPAGLVWFYADFALDSAMTHPVRVARPFGVGHVTGVGPGTSHLYRLVQSGTALTTDVVSTMATISPYGVVFAPETIPNGSLPAAGSGSWDVPGDMPGASYATVAAAQYLNILVNQLGVVCALVGFTDNGGNTSFWPASGGSTAKSLAALTHGGTAKWDAQVSICAMNDAGISTRAVIANRLVAAFGAFQAANNAPGMAVLSCSSPLWTANYETADRRYTYVATRDAATALTAAGNPAVAYDQFDSGGPAVNGHSTQPGRKRWAAGFARCVLGLLGTAKGGWALNRGPKVVSATKAGAVIHVTVQHDKGANLVKYAWREPAVTGNGTDAAVIPIASIADTWLRYLVTVYPAGKNWNAGDPFVVSKITITGPSTFDVYLAADPDPTGTQGFDLYYGLDLNSYGMIFADTTPGTGPGGLGVAMKDDTDQGSLGYGMDVRQTFDPIYVSPSSPPARSILLNTPVDTTKGALIALSGDAGTGPALAGGGSFDAASSVEVSVNGAAYTVPQFLLVKNDNSWSGFLPAPNAAGAGLSLAVRRAGQSAPDATTTFNIVTAANALPASSRANAVCQFDASNIGTMWQDTARTVPAANGQFVRAMDDALGTAGNLLTTWGQNTQVTSAGFYDMRKPLYYGAQVNSRYVNRMEPKFDRPSILFESGTTSNVSYSSRLLVGSSSMPLLSTLVGPCTVMMVHDYNSNAGGFWFAGKVGAAPTFSWSYNQANSPALYYKLDAQANSPAAYRYGSNTPSFPAVTNVSRAEPAYGAGVYVAYQGRTIATFVSYDPATGILSLDIPAKGMTGTYTSPDLSTDVFNAFILGYSPDAGSGSNRFHELVAFNTVLSTAQKTDLVAYAAGKWPG